MPDNSRFHSLDRARLREDHERLHAFLERLRSEHDRERLTALLDELPGQLEEHFRREEAPDGFYAALGVSLDEARGEIGRLLDDHFRLASMARDIAQGARAPGVTTDTLREQSARVADYLADHERLERELARALDAKS